MKKVIFFPDDMHEATQNVKEELAQKYSCFSSSNLDEYSQVFHQSGKFVLLFSDAKLAVNFLDNSSNFLNDLTFKTYLYLAKNGQFKPESQKILDTYKINFYKLSESHKLMESIDKYLSETQDETLLVDELEFLGPKDDNGTTE